MKRYLTHVLFAALALFVHLPGHAEDIDLFVGASSSSSTDKPNVLIILDNTANWSSPFTNEIAALKTVFNGLTLDKFRVGIMMFTESGGSNSGNDGAYVRAAIRLMDSTNRPKYSALIDSLDKNDDKSNGGKVAKAMEEAYLYYKALTPHAGNSKVKADYTGNTAGGDSTDAVHALAGNALSGFSSTTYVSPLVSGSCARNYIIYISNGAAQDSSSDITQATTALAAQGGSTTAIALNPSGSQDNVADEWARFMRVSSLGISVYTVDIDKVTTGQGPGWTALLKSMAAQSSGSYFDVSSSGTGIQDALNTIFSEIQSVNSVFASVSLPVSVNTQGSYLNQVYVGMFRPDSNALPRWAGNLKQYKLGKINGVVKLQDAAGNAAINSQTGFITECARSYWTPSAVDTEWTFRPQGDCLTVANSQVSNYPDGNVVDKGAQAYKLRASSTRTVMTCSATMASCTSLLPFNGTNVSDTDLGVSGTTDRDNLINWAIGQDIQDEDIDEVKTTERRLSAHGDVVHSRPVALNYGTDASSNVVVFYGANDGMLRAVNGNRGSTSDATVGAIGSVPAGGELWSFMPPEFYSSIKRIRDNTEEISYPESGSGSPKAYGMDGPITAYKGDSSSFIYGTMRRGGRSVYGFDVTDPASPTLKWKKGCPNAADDTDCTSGMTGIGQTWSSLKSFTAAGHGSGATPLLIMGGGYDTCDDYDARSAGGANHNCSASSKGHYIYVIEADSGDLVQTFDTSSTLGGSTRGIVADVTLVRDSLGHAIYGYTADLGGNVYRITFGSGAAASWTIAKIASLGCEDTSACAANRKFMFAPSVVAVSTDEYAIMLGSGDREKPLTYYTAAGAVANRFFKFTDKPTIAASTWPGSADCGSAIICTASLLGITTTSTPTTAQLAEKKGWYLGLDSTEQVVTSAITIFGVVTFSTHQPAVSGGDTCSANLGTSRVYNVGYTNAASGNGTDSRYEDIAGDGLPPSPVGGQFLDDDGVTLIPFCIGCSKDSPLEGVEKSGGALTSQPKTRLYWYIQK